MSEPYTKGFFADIRAGSMRSAEEIVPLVLGLVPARSVVDVGCGDGSWLAVFRKNGVLDLLGIDGDYVDRNTLQVPQEQFQAADLSKPLQVGRKFDLAVSLEVAEHLPPECAASFVKSLTRLAPIILFSAAIPLQGGMHHVNEQWPDRWAELFQEHDYRLVDCIRKRVWQNDAVEYFYAQNALLFVRSDALEGNQSLALEFERTNPNQLRLVHPRKYLELANPYRAAPGLRAASRIWLATLKQSIEWRLRPFRSSRSAKNGGRQCPPQNR